MLEPPANDPATTIYEFVLEHVETVPALKAAEVLDAMAHFLPHSMKDDFLSRAAEFRSAVEATRQLRINFKSSYSEN